MVERRWRVEFFTDKRDRSPPLEYIDSLTLREQIKIRNHLILLAELGPQIGMPHARALKGYKHLWELRPMPTRLIYFMYKEQRIVILHAFKKKSNKTPSKEIDLAARRMERIVARER